MYFIPVGATNEVINNYAPALSNTLTLICPNNEVFVNSYSDEVLEVNWREKGTEFWFNRPYTKPNNLTLTYEIVEPSGFTYDEIRFESNYVYLIIYDA